MKSEIILKKIIDKGNITSYGFYNVVLPKVQNKQLNLGDEVIFNFNGIKIIDPIVIPYFICIAEWCNQQTNRKTIFRLNNDLDNENLIQYLSAINFKEQSKEVYSFEEEWGYSSDETTIKKQEQVKNNTLFNRFDITKIENRWVDERESFISREAVWEYIVPMFYQPSYISTRQKYYLDDILCGRAGKEFSQDITRMLTELTHNALFHGHANCYFLSEYVSSNKCIRISLSDLGQGMRQSFNINKSTRTLRFSKEDFNLFEEERLDENLHAMVESILLRLWKQNGLYGSIYTVLKNDGKIRIHSDNCQLILTNRAKDFFSRKGMILFEENNEALKQEFLNFLKWDPKDVKTSNIRKTAFFPGVHFELEMPVPENYM